MNMLKDVESFHREMGFAPFREVDAKAVDEKREALVMEEAAELCEAIRLGDKAKILHEGIDNFYVILGAFVEAGITWAELSNAWAMVHQANMSKDAPDDPLGKAEKGERFEVADVSRALGATEPVHRYAVTCGEGKSAKSLIRASQGPMGRDEFIALVAECQKANGCAPTMIFELE